MTIFTKDLGIVSDMAGAASFPTPLAAAALQMFLMTAASGMASEDYASVASLYAKIAGLEPPRWRKGPDVGSCATREGAQRYLARGGLSTVGLSNGVFMRRLTGKVAWVTGAGSGIGEAGALALAEEGASVMLTGRRKEPLEAVAARIAKEGGTSRVHPGDMSRSEDASRIAGRIEEEFGRLDILVNNAGSNIPDRSWKRLTPAGLNELISANLSSAFHGAIAALPIMRKQKDGVIINIASIAGRFVSTQPGVGYIAAKHGVVALSHSINMEECRNGIRSTALSPGEVATPILAKRPVPVSDEEKARMLQSQDLGDLIRYIACLPSHVCLNDVLITPTWNRGYISAQDQGF